MPDEPQDDQTPLTSEQIVELRKAKAELDSLRPVLEKFTLKDGETTETVNLLTQDGQKRLQERGSGGLHLHQKAEKLNAEKAAFAESQKKAEAELKAKLEEAGKPAGEGAVRKKMADVLKENPAIKAKFEDGDATWLDDWATLQDSVMPTAEPPKARDGLTREEASRLYAMESRVIPNAEYQLLTAALGIGDKRRGATMVAEELKRRMEAGLISSDTDFATAMLNVTHEWATTLGLKAEPPKAEEEPGHEAEPGKETPPRGGGSGAGAGAGAESPMPKNHADAMRFRKEREAKERAGGKQHSYYDL